MLSEGNIIPHGGELGSKGRLGQAACIKASQMNGGREKAAFSPLTASPLFLPLLQLAQTLTEQPWVLPNSHFGVTLANGRSVSKEGQRQRPLAGLWSSSLCSCPGGHSCYQETFRSQLPPSIASVD